MLLNLDNIEYPKLLESCRFCLKWSKDMRKINDQSSSTSAGTPEQINIPNLYELVTSLKLDISSAYSELICVSCEERMKNIVHDKQEFLEIDEYWKKVLNQINIKLESSKEINQIDEIHGIDGIVISESIHLDNNKLDPFWTTVVINNDDNGAVVNSNYNAEFIDRLDLTENLDSIKKNTARIGCYQCDVCQLIFKNRIAILRHMRQKHKAPKYRNDYYECDICGKKIISRTFFQRHIRSHYRSTNNPDKSLKNDDNNKNTGRTCHLCGKTNLKWLAGHMRDHRKQDQFKCDVCCRTFSRNDQLKQHQRIHTGERPFVCESCGYSFTSASGLTRHRKKHNSSFQHSASSNAQHINMSKTQQKRQPIQIPNIATIKLPPRIGKKLSCSLCQGSFVNRSSLYQHLKHMHIPDGLNAWKQILDTTCMICYNTFETNVELVDHRLTHAEHECHICRRRFLNKITLEFHVNAHSKKERKFKCEICEATFVTVHYMKQHIKRAHTNERPFVCTNCPSSFVERCDLNNHMRKVHSYVKPHQCNECPEAFKTAALLRSHKERHTGEFRYRCGICNRPSFSGPLLTEHMRNYHPTVV